MMSARAMPNPNCAGPDELDLGMLDFGRPGRREVQDALAVAWRAGLEVGPGRLVLLEELGLMRSQLSGMALFVGLDDGPVILAMPEGLQARCLHSACLDQRRHLGNVDRAPDRRLLSRREADLVRHVINALAHAVDSAEAQGFVNRL